MCIVHVAEAASSHLPTRQHPATRRPVNEEGHACNWTGLRVPTVQDQADVAAFCAGSQRRARARRKPSHCLSVRFNQRECIQADARHLVWGRPELESSSSARSSEKNLVSTARGVYHAVLYDVPRMRFGVVALGHSRTVIIEESWNLSRLRRLPCMHGSLRVAV